MYVAMAGMDPIYFLKCEDRFETQIMQALSYKYIEDLRQMDLARATMIANAVGKMLGG